LEVSFVADSGRDSKENKIMKQISMLILAAALLAAGCSGAGSRKIDGSSEEAMQKSVQEITKSMSADEKKKFEDAMMAIAAKHIFGNMFKEGADPEKEALKAVDGKTAAEIIAEGEKIRAEMKK
jgi:PBP1b-binding outer membrane lipoprotein LpoB